MSLGHEGTGLMNGMSIIIRDPKQLPHPFYHVRMWRGNRPSPNTESASAMILDFPAYWTMKNMHCLWATQFIVLLLQLEQIKTNFERWFLDNPGWVEHRHFSWYLSNPSPHLMKIKEFKVLQTTQREQKCPSPLEGRYKGTTWRKAERQQITEPILKKANQEQTKELGLEAQGTLKVETGLTAENSAQAIIYPNLKRRGLL